MKRIHSLFLKLSFWTSIVLIIGTPLHGLLSTFFRFKLGWAETSILNLGIQAWKEALILLLAFSALTLLPKAWKKWNKIEQKKYSWFLYALLIFFTLGASITLLNWNETGFSHLIWGARTEWAFLLLLGSWLITIPLWTKKQKKCAINALIYTALAILFFGLILGITGHEWLTHLGFRNDWSTFYQGEAPAFCQREAGTEFCRWQSTFTGPNRYAGYLLSILPLSFLLKSWKRWTLIGIAVFSLLFTYSSSALLAAVFTAGLWIWISIHKELESKSAKVMLWTLPITVAVVGLTTIIFFTDFLAGASESEHISRSLAGLQLLIENPLGSGLAASGPASYKVGLDFIPESWWIQVGVNNGIIGLLLFLAIWVKLGLELWNKQSKLSLIALAAALGVLTQNLFLHTLEDAGTYLPFILLIVLALNTNKVKLEQ